MLAGAPGGFDALDPDVVAQRHIEPAVNASARNSARSGRAFI
jgi:hypothetical protein